MRKLLFLLPLCALLANCSEKTYNKLSVPEIEHFRMLPNGDIVFTGSGMNALKDLTVSFDISIADHESLGTSLLVFSGSSVDIKDDKEFTIHADNLEKVQLKLTKGEELSKDVQAYVQAVSSGKDETNFTVTDIALNKQLLTHVGSAKQDYALWLTLKDLTKSFWDPADKMETTFKFGFYQFSAMKPGNFSSYNKKVMEWEELPK